jgi:hypothetical protein
MCSNHLVRPRVPLRSNSDGGLTLTDCDPQPTQTCRIVHSAASQRRHISTAAPQHHSTAALHARHLCTSCTLLQLTMGHQDLRPLHQQDRTVAAARQG